MADKTQLDTWGAQGTDTPAGYSHLAGEQAVAEWENDFKYGAIDRINYLLPLTQDRLDSGTGATFPTSPTDGQLHWKDNVLSVRKESTLAWKALAYQSAVDTVSTNLTNHEADTANPHSVTLAQVGGAPASHTSDTANPHSVTAAQVAAVAKAGDSMSGTLNLSAGRLVAPVGLDKYATQ